MTYMEQLISDIEQVLADDFNVEEYSDDLERLADDLNDYCWDADSVTGNGSGSYYFHREKAKQQVLENGMDYLNEAVKDFGITEEEIGRMFLQEGWGGLDVIIRCHLLDQAIREVIDKLQ